MGACIRGSMESEGMLPRSIYYGRIGSEGTERLLERFGHDGSFLLRDSETVPGVFCLCVRKTPFVYTYRLVHSSDGWFLQLQNSFTWKHATAAAAALSAETPTRRLKHEDHDSSRTRATCCMHF
ncbi:phosphatidylinositol 3,4,5-trisphosphate 5-phosphatase 2-like isoform X2 [Cheilinus undulatus]|uniref:phosphatidylinositol 3,4,5-trisphosphate 5-phosphatase 2-like isoform X2 n=1 Tax=Cheilinus undulatus TaxID=241271 RepID=UPI001BD5BF92|nr:phosphatidylinositol 3,4,5-trisphosphate 5-phosphatase 2-like isoform X2 [Cheilinus undulatus]